MPDLTTWIDAPEVAASGSAMLSSRLAGPQTGMVFKRRHDRSRHRGSADCDPHPRSLGASRMAPHKGYPDSRS